MEGHPDDQLRPGEVIKPPLDKDAAVKLVQRLYGLTVKELKEMISYDDRNFHITVETSYDNTYIPTLCPNGYTLKFVNKLDSKNTSFIDCMNEILLRAESKGLQVPIPVKNKAGEFWSSESLCDESGSSNLYIVRLLTFLPGTTVCHVSYTPSVLYQWGRLLARFHQAMEGHVDNRLEKRNSLWSLYSVPRILEFLYAVENQARRHLVTEIVNSFSEVLKLTKNLPTAIIHGDFNEHNILVQENGDNVDVYGVLDLGDLHIAPILFDVAIMLTYTMIECGTMDPLEAAGHALAGYKSLLPLLSSEYQLLKLCISARLCQSLVMGAYTHSLDPSNNYVLSTARTGWTILDKLWSTPQQKLYEMWDNIIQCNYQT